MNQKSNELIKSIDFQLSWIFYWVPQKNTINILNGLVQYNELIKKLIMSFRTFIVIPLLMLVGNNNGCMMATLPSCCEIFWCRSDAMWQYSSSISTVQSKHVINDLDLFSLFPLNPPSLSFSVSLKLNRRQSTTCVIPARHPETSPLLL